jgi:hypothetical protein
MPRAFKKRADAASDSHEVWLVVSRRIADALVDEVVRARTGLREPVTFELPAGDDDVRCDPVLVQVDRVVETGTEHRRRAAVELRRAEHDDRFRGASIIGFGCSPHLHEGHDVVQEEDQQDGKQRQEHELAGEPRNRDRHQPKRARTARSRRSALSRPSRKIESNKGSPAALPSMAV